MRDVPEQELRSCDEYHARKTAYFGMVSSEWVGHGTLYVHPAISSFLEKGSFRKMALAIPVKIGDRNVRTVASDSERYLNEK